MAVAITEDSAAGSPLTDSPWHEKAPRKLLECSRSDDPAESWKVWQRHLKRRKKPAAPEFLKAGGEPGLLWGWPIDWQREAVAAAVESPSALAENALGEDGTTAIDLPRSLELVALAYALPKLAAELPAEVWWNVVERLQTIATQARTERVDWQQDAIGVVRNQLLASELPLVLGSLFPEVRSLRALRDEARVVLSEALVELTDGQGLIHGKLLPVFAPLFGCWTRCRTLGGKLRRGPWSRAAEVQYQWMVRHAIRLAKADGSFHFANAASGWTTTQFRMALQLAGDRGDHAAALHVLPSGVLRRARRFKQRDLPGESLNSDWAGVTVMASGWKQSSARMALKYTDDPLSVELSVDGETLLAGKWQATTHSNGELVQPAGEWEQLCWESGKKFDLLELGLTLSHGLRLERQIVFGRRDRVFYLADLILADDGEPRKLQHTLELPLAPGVKYEGEAETRDGTLIQNKVHAAVLPLALREWRADPRGGSLNVSDGRLVLTQEAQGRALCCPLFIDLNTKRSKCDRTWRQLTVAEWMEIIPPDVAVGYRAQTNNSQWIFYRSLGPASNRTLVGHNIAGEFCAGRFVEGKFKEWIEIEPVE